MDGIALVVAAGVLGAMAFFLFAVTPLVFRTLDAAEAGRLVRALFPVYYAVAIAGAGVAGLLALPSWPGWLAILVALIALGLRQQLSPAIDREREAQRAGDAAAGMRFDRLHRLSVLANLVLLLALAVAVLGLAI